MSDESQQADMSDQLNKLQAIADPVRLRIHEMLRARGALAQAQIVKTMPKIRGSIRFHLKQLEQNGFIEKAGANVWRAKPNPVSWDPALYDNDEWRLTTKNVERVYIRHRIKRWEGWLEESEQWAPEWRESVISDDALLRLSPSELVDLREKIDTVLEPYRALSKERTANLHEDGTTEPVYYVAGAFPIRPGLVVGDDKD